MTLITCAADCVHQQEGYCQLCGGAPVSCTAAHECCHYQKIKPCAPKLSR